MTPSRRAAETAWKADDRLVWCGGEYVFERFDPAYPRAICHDDKSRSVAINITTAKRIDPATHRKRAERLRRKEAGEVRIEAWIVQSTVVRLDAFAKENSLTRSEAVEVLIWNAETVK